MALPLYLAMTSAEFTVCSSLPRHPAWMACHFSPYGTGLTNLPPDLRSGAMVILNDRVPISGHDPEYILDQLRHLKCSCLLLDFQRAGVPETAALTKALVDGLDRPVGVSMPYAGGLDCPVFLPPPPLDVPPKEYLSPWQGREIWLEAALDGLCYTVTEQGSQPSPLPHIPENGQQDDALFCHYRVTVEKDRAEFDLWRTRQDLDDLLQKAQAHGVTKAVGLWQELGR